MGGSFITPNDKRRLKHQVLKRRQDLELAILNVHYVARDGFDACSVRADAQNTPVSSELEAMTSRRKHPH